MSFATIGLTPLLHFPAMKHLVPPELICGQIFLAVDDRTAGLVLKPMERRIIPTGLRVEIPQGFEMQIRPRSGLAAKHGVTLANTPGTIDSDYRGPLGVILINLGAEPFVVGHGDRIAQAVIAPVLQANYTLVDTLSDTDRGAGGFGSTGRS